LLTWLIEGRWPYLWIDASYLKSHQGGLIVSVAAMIAVAVHADGRRDARGVHQACFVA